MSKGDKKVIPEKITIEQRIQNALRDARERPAEYEAEFHEKLDLPKYEEGERIVEKMNENEPFFRDHLVRIEATLSAIVASKEFRNTLAGTEINDDWVKDGDNYVRPELDPVTAEKRDAADTVINKLKWAFNALADTGGGESHAQQVEGVRQSRHLAKLLKQDAGIGRTVYDVLKAAAKQIKKEQPAAYVPKSQKGKQPEQPAQQAGQQEQTLFDSLYEDLYYLDSNLELGLDMPKLDPESAVPAPDLRQVNSWKEYQEAHTARMPYDPEARKEHLAKALVGAFQAGRVSANQILQNGAKPPKPYSQKQAEEYVRQLKAQPVFKKFCQDPKLVKDLLTPDPRRPHKQFNGMMNMFRPFGNVEPEKGRAVLNQLKSMLPLMDKPAGRSKEWQALYRSIETIDTNDPHLDMEKKLQEIFDKNNAYMKGKKSLRKNQELQNRFDQSMDVLSVLSKSGTYAKFAAETVVDRVNEVRLGHDSKYKSKGLDHYGADKLTKHSNTKLTRYALDVLPQDPAQLQPLPDKLRNVVTYVDEYAELVEPLQTDRELSTMEAEMAIAAAVVLSKRQVYCFTGAPKTKDQQKLIERHGRAVIDKRRLGEDMQDLLGNPAVIKLAEKYRDPQARKELLREIAPEPEKQPGKKSVGWTEKNVQIDYQKGSAPLKVDKKRGNQELLKMAENIDEDAIVRTVDRKVMFNVPEKPKYDPKKLNVGKLLQEYDQAVRETAPAQAQL